MDSALTPTTPNSADLERIQTYAAQAWSQNTLRAYHSDWAHFTAWCAGRQADPLPASPVTVAAYIGALADQGMKVATIVRRLAAISKAHATHGHESPASQRFPVVKEVLKGVKNALGTAQEGKAPLLTADIARLVGVLDRSTLSGKRDATMILLGFAGGFRRSELVDLDVEDLDVTEDGLVVTIWRSKTDQEGHGTTVGIPYGSNPATCPLRTLKAWLEASGITHGPLFRPIRKGGHLAGGRITDQVVRLVIQRACEKAGLDPARFSAHSLRSGMVTQALRNGASDHAVMDQTRHRTPQMVRRYRREAELFRDNAAAKLGL